MDSSNLDLAAVRVAFTELQIADRLGEGGHKAAFQAIRAGQDVVLKVLKEPLPAGSADADAPDVVAVIEPGPGGALHSEPPAPVGASSPDALTAPSEEERIEPSLPPRLQREIEAMRRVHSRRVVTILDGPAIREIAGRRHWWYLEPFYVGGTLEHRIARGPMEADEATSLCDALLEGVDDLWTQVALVHRDIKPSNVVFDEAGEPVLLDLGIVLDTTATPLTDPAHFGPRTNRYCAPEQLLVRRMADLDARTDLFLVGVCVFEAYTGLHPFAPFDHDFVSRVRNGAFDRAALDARPPGELLKKVLGRLLRARQHERYRLPSLARAVLRGDDM